MAETKECPNCEKNIAATEEKCPACGIVIADFEDAVETVSKAQAAIERRRRKETPPAPLNPEPKRSKLAALGSIIRKRG